MPPVSPADVSLYNCSVKLLDSLSTTLNQSVVFVDDCFAEVLHWHGGATALFTVGVRDVLEFSAFESCDADEHNAVFLLSRPMGDAILDTLRSIITSSCFHHVTVVTSVCPAMHTLVEYGVGQVDDEWKALLQCKQKITDWIESTSPTAAGTCTVNIQYIPLIAAPILPSMFVFPLHTELFPLLPTDFPFIRRKEEGRASAAPVSIEFVQLPKNLQLQLKLLVCSLSSLFDVLGCSEEIFALGVTSNIVASELASLSWNKTRRKNASMKASLLLVDRTLDVASVVGHGQDCLLDKIISLLPRLPGHYNDIAVEMAPVSSVIIQPNFSAVAPGCLAHPDDVSASALLNAIAMLKYKEALLEVNRLLVEAVNRESLTSCISTGPPVLSVGRIGPDQLESQISLFRGKSTNIRKHSGVLQLTLAVVQTLRHPSSSKLDRLLGIEKGLLQCLSGDEDIGPLAQLNETVRKEMKLDSKERLLNLDDVLLLLAYIYSLIGENCTTSLEEENMLKNTLCEAVMQLDEDSGIFSELVDGDRTERKCMVAVQSVLEKLKGLSRARQGLKKYSSVYEPGSLTSPAKFQSLLRQLVADIVDPSKPELPDIVHKSTGYGDLLKSGFGLFRSSSKPRPSDHPLLIVFIIGGATSTEVRQIRDVAATAKSNMQVLVGSTSLVNPADILRRAVVQDNLHP